MHPHARDLLRGRESRVAPALAAIRRLEHPIAMRDVAPDRMLPRTDVNDVGVRRGHVNGADRAAEVSVARGRPAIAAIGRLEHAAPCRTHPVFEGALRGTRHRDAPPAAKNSNVAPPKSVPRDGVFGDGAGIRYFLCAESTCCQRGQESDVRELRRHAGEVTTVRAERQLSLDDGGVLQIALASRASKGRCECARTAKLFAVRAHSIRASKTIKLADESRFPDGAT